MPTYDYAREDGTVFEFFQGMNDAPLETCPETGQKVKRLISGGSGVIYKGDGWYVTDYKNKNGNGKSDGTGTANGSADKSQESSATATQDAAAAAACGSSCACHPRADS
jgi:putative FmdB family regulatory protein